MTNFPIVFAQAASVGYWAIMLVVICGIIGIAMVVIRQSGIAIPGFIVTIFWIILAVFLGVAAIKFVMSNL